jgi:hypothetical protein
MILDVRDDRKQWAESECVARQRCGTQRNVTSMAAATADGQSGNEDIHQCEKIACHCTWNRSGAIIGCEGSPLH